ncbi:MAG: dTMP kinase [Candidatus Gastranaerophilales bacterium]|nr:dTMP kinase [Candidatus Gastranaerophilales bacterium]
MKNKGLFITFEGIDGCGKTTQMNLLADYLKAKGQDVLITREPGAIGLGEKIREILLNYNGEVSSNCEAFLFLADRAQHIDIIVKPAIKAGKIVLCDRHTDSTVAYQGWGRDVDLEQIKMLNSLATSGLKPDLTFVFDIDVETALSRVGKTKDRMESAGPGFFEKTSQGYLEIAKQEPHRVKVINSNDSIENIFEQVKEYIEI